MSRYDRNARAGADRASLYDDITNKIIAELEAGRVPWVQPWGTAAARAPLAMPANAATSRAYSGINVLILWGAVVEHGFPVQSWLTAAPRAASPSSPASRASDPAATIASPPRQQAQQEITHDRRPTAIN
jgi:antirestriction protein ArdC